MTQLHNLPDRQRQILHCIIRSIEDQGKSPTHSELADATGMLEQQVHAILNALEKKGRIRRDPKMHRSITVIE